MLLFCALGLQSVPAQTSQPVLRIASSNGVNTVFWPLTAYSHILQTAPNLSPSATWTNLVTGDQVVALNTYPFTGGYAVCLTNVVGDEMAYNLPTNSGQRFFRTSTTHYLNPCNFAIFYYGLLEFSGGATMIVNGRVHASGPIYVGTSASLTFNATVTTASGLSAPLVGSTGWTPSNPSTWNTFFNGNPGYITNATGLDVFKSDWTNFHCMVEIPPANEDPTSPNGMVRLYNSATVILLVTNDISSGTNPTVKLTIQTSVNGTLPGNDPNPLVLLYTNVSPARLSTNLPFLSLTNQFYDQREQKTNLVTQIDVGRFSSWVSTNQIVQNKLPLAAGMYPPILYVADRRNVTPRQLAVVRLKNGAQLLHFNMGYGFTPVTPNPLYVWGNYNVQTSASDTNAPAGTSNTVPAALISDALTVLSPNWTDSESFTAYSQSATANDAADMIINAAIITGTVASTGTSSTTFSGGVHNLPRLLEDWTGRNLWLNTSIIRLWDSQRATNQFRNPAGFNPAPVNPYYNPPTRHFSYDTNFLNPYKIPPGVPLFIVTP